MCCVRSRSVLPHDARQQQEPDAGLKSEGGAVQRAASFSRSCFF
jgi:hypothetical protein